ncbi:uncharacterized protein [Amphiura filiformis]|uniref:uncharacterized protein isoform X2 n=1 Tax=Amphiura filiformis TaxID=82378 RepID=UPI003B21150A
MMKKDHFSVDTDANGKHYVYQAKDVVIGNKNPDDDSIKSRADGRRLYETQAKWCPVASFEKYISKLNRRCNSLFQTPIERSEFNWYKASNNHDKPWYNNSPVAEKTLGSFMTKLSLAADLSRRYTNHSVKVTSITVLNEIVFAARDNFSASGHQTVSSINTHIGRPNDREQQKLPGVVSLSNSQPVSEPKEKEDITADKPSTSCESPLTTAPPAQCTTQAAAHTSTLDEEVQMIQEPLKQMDCKHTHRTMVSCAKMFKAYLASEDLPTNFEEFDKKELADSLAKFYVHVEAGREDGKPYKAKSLFYIRAGLNQLLKNTGKEIDIVTDPIFSRANLVISANEAKLNNSVIKARNTSSGHQNEFKHRKLAGVVSLSNSQPVSEPKEKEDITADKPSTSCESPSTTASPAQCITQAAAPISILGNVDEEVEMIQKKAEIRQTSTVKNASKMLLLLASMTKQSQRKQENGTSQVTYKQNLKLQSIILKGKWHLKTFLCKYCTRHFHSAERYRRHLRNHVKKYQQRYSHRTATHEVKTDRQSAYRRIGYLIPNSHGPGYILVKIRVADPVINKSMEEGVTSQVQNSTSEVGEAEIGNKPPLKSKQQIKSSKKLICALCKKVTGQKPRRHFMTMHAIYDQAEIESLYEESCELSSQLVRRTRSDYVRTSNSYQKQTCPYCGKLAKRMVAHIKGSHKDCDANILKEFDMRWRRSTNKDKTQTVPSTTAVATQKRQLDTSNNGPHSNAKRARTEVETTHRQEKPSGNTYAAQSVSNIVQPFVKFPNQSEGKSSTSTGNDSQCSVCNKYHTDVIDNYKCQIAHLQDAIKDEETKRAGAIKDVERKRAAHQQHAIKDKEKKQADLALMMNYDNLQWRVEQKVEKHTEDHPECHCGCWEWTAACTNVGYGVMYMAGRMLGAHRASYMAFNQCVDLPHDIVHVCKRKKCVNPDHLSHEERDVNMGRQTCNLVGHCTGKHISKDGKNKTCIFIKCKKIKQ